MKKFALLVLAVATTVAAFWLAISLNAPLMRAAPSSKLVLWVGGVACAWLALAIHELGHAVAAHTQGLDFRILIVGPLRVERSPDGRYSVRLNRSLLLWGPMTRSFPRDPENLLRRSAIHAAGGPGASLVLALGAWLLALRCQPGSEQYFLGLLSVCSFSVFVGTAQPFGAGVGTISDGEGLWRLLRGDVVAARDVATVALAGAIVAGVRPRDWPAETVSQSLMPSDGSLSELLALARAASHADPPPIRWTG